MSMSTRRNLKLFPKYYGPFQVIYKVGKVAYKLDLPSESRIFPIFHVSSLKKTLEEWIHPNPQLPEVTVDETLAPAPDCVLQRRLKRKRNRAAMEVLLKWQGTTEEEATWEIWRICAENFQTLRARSSEGNGRVMRRNTKGLFELRKISEIKRRWGKSFGKERGTEWRDKRGSWVCKTCSTNLYSGTRVVSSQYCQQLE
jgi:hypothetical protein